MLDEFLLVLGQVGQGEEVLQPGGGAHLHIEVEKWPSLHICEGLWTSLNIFEHLWTSVTIFDHLWTSLNICEHLWTIVNVSDNLWTSVTIFEHMWTSLNICENISEYQWRSLNSSENTLIYVKIYVNSCGHLKTSWHTSPSSLRKGLKLGAKKGSIHWDHQTPLRFCRIEDDDLGRKGKCSCQLSC